MNAPSSGGAGPAGVGLIGCGKMGLEHLRALARIPGIEIVGVADPAADAAEVQAVAGRAVPVYADAARLLAEARPASVHIVTPPETHARLALQCLAAGCHVYVEKPFAMTRAEAAEVLALAGRLGLQACAGHQCLFEYPALRAMELLPGLGRISHVRSYFAFRQVRRAISAVDQCKDILPHSVYPLLQQIRSGQVPADLPVEILGVDARVTGDLLALLRVGDRTGVVEVSLTGRPVEQYQEIVGSQGTLTADYPTGSVIEAPGPGTGLGVFATPWRRARQIRRAARRTFFRLVTGRRESYAGLHELIRRFHAQLAGGGPAPIAPRAILDTVDVCEQLARHLDLAQDEAERTSEQQLRAQERALPPVRQAGTVLVTGGTGFLGRKVAGEIRLAGFRTRVACRRTPPPSKRLPGVEYVAADLARDLEPQLLDGVDTVVHCAAETAGGRNEHQRNSVTASLNLMRAAASAGVPKFLHVSSLAVLKPAFRARTPLDEASPVDAGNLSRGPYVWGKAESELAMQRLAAESGIQLRVIRPGPLVDYSEFEAPGRLGRDLGPAFVAVGSPRKPLFVCEVRNAAKVIRCYVQDFASAPPVVNLVDSPPPTRGELVAQLLRGRPGLRILWLPLWLLKLLNGPAKLAQRVLLGSTRPVDFHAAFADQRYRTELAANVIQRAGECLAPD